MSGPKRFYGRPSMVRDAIPRMKAPLLLLIAGADQATPQDEFVQFDQELTEARVPHQKVGLPGRAALLLRSQLCAAQRGVR